MYMYTCVYIYIYIYVKVYRKTYQTYIKQVRTVETTNHHADLRTLGYSLQGGAVGGGCSDGGGII